MFDYDVLEPGALVEPEALIARGADLQRLAVLTPLRSLPIKRPLLLAPETSVAEAAEKMIAQRVHAALVVCADSVLGLVDETDILKLVRYRYADLDRISVWKAMTPEPPVCLDTDSVATALRHFRTTGTSHLSVLKEDGGAPLGILDLGGIVEWMSGRLTVVVFDGIGRE
jgi:CBS domain-containing protein